MPEIRVGFHLTGWTDDERLWFQEVAELAGMEIHARKMDYDEVIGFSYTPDRALGRQGARFRTEDRPSITPKAAVDQLLFLWEHLWRSEAPAVVDGREISLQPSLAALKEAYPDIGEPEEEQAPA